MKLRFGFLFAALLLFAVNKIIAQSQVQVIHNSADLSITTVDIYMDNNIFFDDAIFRSCSQFENVPSGVTDVVIAASNSTDTTNALFRKTINFTSGVKYVLVLNGIVSGSGYNPLTPFDIYEFANARDSAMTTGNIDILFFQGVTDGGTVDIRDLSSGVYFSNVSYGAFDGYNAQPINDITLRVTDAGGGTTINSYLLPAATFGFMDVAVTVLYSGFDDPSMNSNAPFPASLWMALPVGGGLLDLPVVTGIGNTSENLAGVSMYPNPVSTTLFLDVKLMESEPVLVEIYDLIGAKVHSTTGTKVKKGNNHLDIDVRNLKNGIYFCQVKTGTSTITRKLEVRH